MTADWLGRELRITNDDVTDLNVVEFLNWICFYRDKAEYENELKMMV